MNLRDAALRLALLKTVLDRVKDEYADARLAMEAEMREAGADAVKPQLGDVRLGSVTLTRGTPTPTVDDAAAFLAWVQEHYPTEVQTVEQVRGAFLASLLPRLVIAGDDLVDPDTGVFVDGLSLRAGSEYVSVRMTADGKQAVADALSTGAVTLQEVMTQSPRHNEVTA